MGREQALEQEDRSRIDDRRYSALFPAEILRPGALLLLLLLLRLLRFLLRLLDSAALPLRDDLSRSHGLGRRKHRQNGHAKDETPLHGIEVTTPRLNGK